ncbi:lytic transglycosylase domain-containing protein [Candidatus Clostridium radicumherbarum]|uniref:Lytic transglycosylase domain-containing protein n=1 Tax=Candidatus Clostridium radicumherbarum TaxID=3381662 RepID=A0ABW8TTA0_9CLOT
MKHRGLFTVFVILLLVILIVEFSNISKILYPFNYVDSINKYSKKYNLDPYLISAVIKTESNYKSRALSSKNAYGLMQITPDTAEWAAKQMKLDDYKNEKLFDPDYNINMGCWYLDNLKKEFNGNMDLVLAAYNGGRGNVEKWLADSEHSKDGVSLHYIPFKETDKYIKRVKVNYNIYKFLYKNKFTSDVIK